jgi:hypothetical protein
MAVPEDATEVFDVNAITGNGTSNRAINTGFVTDVHLSMRRSSNYPNIVDRLRGHGSGRTKRLATHVTNAETDLTGNYWLGLDTNDGYILSSDYENQSSQTYVQYAWKRAPNYFDVVAYTGTGSSSLTVDHNLGVVPEMMWVKRRSGTSDWKVYHKDLTNLNSYLVINSTAAEVSNQTNVWPTAPTDTQLTIGNYTGDYTGGGDQGIAYLFASLDGVSKVGSYTGNGTGQNIDCGFTNGAQLIVIKRTDITQNWYVFDSARGIVAGNDPYLRLNQTAQEYSADYVDPYSAGFAVTGSNVGINASGGTYIFYAIA